MLHNSPEFGWGWAAMFFFSCPLFPPWEHYASSAWPREQSYVVSTFPQNTKTSERRRPILIRIHLKLYNPLMPTDNVQISDVLNSHLINWGFLSAQKPILHAAEYNNSPGVVGGRSKNLSANPYTNVTFSSETINVNSISLTNSVFQIQTIWFGDILAKTIYIKIMKLCKKRSYNWLILYFRESELWVFSLCKGSRCRRNRIFFYIRFWMASTPEAQRFGLKILNVAKLPRVISILFYSSNSFFFQSDPFPLSSLKSDKKAHIVLFCNAMCLGPGLVINCLSGGMLWYVNHNSTSPLDLFNVNKILSEFLSGLRAVLYNWLY